MSPSFLEHRHGYLQVNDNSYQLELNNAKLLLLAEKAVYWEKYKSLFVSDLHLGKVAHFRKNGIALPKGVDDSDLEKISRLVNTLEIENIYFLGDLFHSDYNFDWNIFENWVEKHCKINYHLILGNHDVLDTKLYGSIFKQVTERVEIEEFSFTHEREQSDDLYNISGHIHPGIKLRGFARQSLRLPCFYFSKSFGILPAFGGFTGTHSIKVYKNDLVFCIANNQIISLST
jgi:DNA ligase-associated metallophosphoesterase